MADHSTKSLDDLLAETVEVNCQTCQGNSLPGVPKNHPGYCSVCHGRAYVGMSAYARLTDAERVRVLEREVMRLRPDLAAKHRKESE